MLPEDFDVLGDRRFEEAVGKAARKSCLMLSWRKLWHWGIGMADHSTIDEINILQATKLAMKDAIADLSGKLEGIDYVIFDAVKINDLKLPQEAVIKGDSKIPGRRCRIYCGKGNQRQDDGCLCGGISRLRIREEQGVWDKAAL